MRGLIHHLDLTVSDVARSAPVAKSTICKAYLKPLGLKSNLWATP